MARHLRPIMLSVELAPGSLELAGGDGTLDRADGVAWERPPRGPWESSTGDLYAWRAALEETPAGSGVYVLDADAPSARTATTPRLAGAGWRSWLALELMGDEPDGTSLRFRLEDGTAAWWWNPAAGGGAGAWATATTSSHWSPAADLEAHFATWPSTERELGVSCKLGTTTAARTPAWYGFRVAIGCRHRPDDSDAAFDGLLATLADEVRAVTVAQVEYGGTAIALRGSPADGGPRWSGVDVVYNVTDDPDEATPIAGSFNGSAQTWTPTVAPTLGDVLLIEGTFAPHLVALDADDVDTVIAEIPAVVFEATGTASRIESGHRSAVRDLRSTVPTSLATATPAVLVQEITVRVVTDRGEDGARLADALRAWLGGGRTVISLETGRPSSIVPLADLVRTTDKIAMGVYEQRGTWRISYPALVEGTATRYPAMRAGGLTARLIDGS